MDDVTALAQYGVWARGLDRETAARALLAIGISAGDDPAHLAWSGRRQIADGLRQVLDGHDARNSERHWNKQLPCSWTDPLALPGWEPDAVLPGSDWAQAWEEIGTRYLRLALTVWERNDLVWLTGMLRTVHGIFNTFAVITSELSASWRFPLRVGFLPTPGGRVLHEALTAGFPESSWRSTRIDPVVVDHTRVSCDVLIVDEDPWEVPTTLNTLLEIRTGAVFVARPSGGLESPTMQVVDKIVDLTRAWAVGFVETSDVPTWIVRLVEELSHAQPLDLAFGRTPGDLRVLVADPQVVMAETADQRAQRLAGWLRTISEADTAEAHPGVTREESALASTLTRIAEEGEFLSEAGDASELSRLEAAAGELLDRAGAARRVQARIAAGVVPDRALRHFRPDQEHTIDVHIGIPQPGGWLTAAEPFPEGALTPDRPHRLTVVLTEPSLLPLPQRQEVDVPVVGDSTTARFTLTTRADTLTVDARIILLSGNRVLQTVRLPAEVGDDLSGHDVSDVAVPELAVAPTSDSIGDRRTFAASFLVNHSADGAARATTMTRDRAAMVKLDSETVANAVRKISERLTVIVDRPESFEALDAPASVELLVALAFHGAKLRKALVADSPGLADVMARRGSAIQIVAAKPDAYFPFEFAYDYTTPDPGAGLCPEALATLANPDTAATCPAKHSSEVVCPSGFWAMHHVIERHAFQPATDLPADFALRSSPRRRGQVIHVGPTLFAASDRVDKVVPGSRAAVLTALAATGAHIPVAAWPAWGEAVRQEPLPAALLLLAHTVHNSAVDAYGLEIGTGSIAFDFTDLVPDGPSLVMLLGCETAVAGNVSYERFPAEFRIAGAKVVIATLTEVLGRHAAPIAATLVSEIHRQCSDQPRGMGEVMLALRRRLLGEGMLPVLTLASFGDADWLVGP